jgi:segregation and condensation protein B
MKKAITGKPLAQHIESLIFASEQAIQFDDIHLCLEQALEISLSKKEIQKVLDALVERYQSPEFGIEIVQIGDGYQFLTKGAFHHSVAILLKQSNKKRLSVAAMETLAIIAYKQPVSKGDLEKIRGVNCDYSVQKLLEKELINISGRSEGPGKPILYATSEKFMDYFGLKSMADLPKLKEFQSNDNEIGIQSDSEQKGLDTNID